jgi:hypothetical protein
VRVETPKTRAVDITICDDTFITDHPELYHYTTSEGLGGITKTQTIWAGHYQSLNDSSEVQHFREKFSSALAPKFDAVIQQQQLNNDMRRIYAESGGPERLARDFVDSLYKSTFEQEDDYGRVAPFISSFCTHDSRLLLVLDQFEEFVTWRTRNGKRPSPRFVADLHSTPIKGLRLLLVLRRDYQTAIE